MTDVDALFAAAIAAPLEHTPRLALADALDERGSSGDADRAAFIRLQKELHDVGPPRREIMKVFMIPRGPDYWEIDTEVRHDGAFAVGDRIDVRGGGMNERHDKLYRGLVVTKVIPDAYTDGSFTLAVKRDAYSVKYPKKRADELNYKVFDLLNGHWRDWVPSVPGIDWSDTQAGPVPPSTDPFGLSVCVPDRNTTALGWYCPRWEFRVGLVSAVLCHWGHWLRHGDTLTAVTPITHVTLTDGPHWDSDSDGVFFPGDGGHHISWRKAADNQLAEFGDINHDNLTYFLHARWPSVPVENWSLTVS